jgi:hypothetical protein
MSPRRNFHGKRQCGFMGGTFLVSILSGFVISQQYQISSSMGEDLVFGSETSSALILVFRRAGFRNLN